MFFTRKIIAVGGLLFLLIGCSGSELDSRMLATGVLDDSLAKVLIEKSNLTTEEYQMILQKIEEALRINPEDLSANLLKIELNKKKVN